MNRWIFIVIGAVIVMAGALVIGYFLISKSSETKSDDSVNIKVQLEGARDHAYLEQNADGSYSYLVTLNDGTTQRLSPHDFARAVYAQQKSRNFLEMLFNISSPLGIAWVCFGLLGQVMFSARMIVQWLASEKSKRSVVPPSFWWLSIIGAAMLLSYFLWRQDVVGVLGQGTGLAIYLRNIRLIYRSQPALATSAS